MLKLRDIPLYATLSLLLFLCTVISAVPALGQREQDKARPSERPRSALPREDLRVGLFGGLCFDSENPKEVCWVAMLDVHFYGLPIYPRSSRDGTAYPPSSQSETLYRRPAPVRRLGDDPAIVPEATVVYSFTDTWPPPGNGDPPAALPDQSAKGSGVSEVAKESPQVDHGGTLSVLAGFSLPIPVEPVFLVEPYVGFGFSYIFEGNQERANYALQSKGMPTISYGMGVTAHLKGRLDLIVQYRSLVFFPNTLEYVGPDAVPVTRNDYDTIDTSILLVGFGIRL